MAMESVDFEAQDRGKKDHWSLFFFGKTVSESDKRKIAGHAVYKEGHPSAFITLQ